MIQCNLTKSDESTFFILNVDWVFMRNWVLRYINENAKRSAESILVLYIHFPLSFRYIWCNLNKLFKYNKYQLTKCWLEGNSKVSSEFLKKLWLIEYRIVTKYQDFYYCCRWLHNHNSRGFHVRFYSVKQFLTLTTFKILHACF